MAEESPLRLFPDSPTPSGTPEDSTGKGSSHLGGSIVAMQSMLLNDPISITTTTTSSATVTLDAPSGTHTTSGSAKALLDRVEVEQQHLIALGLSTEVIAEEGLYNSNLWLYMEDLLNVVPEEMVLQFLQDGLRKGLCPATL